MPKRTISLGRKSQTAKRKRCSRDKKQSEPPAGTAVHASDNNATLCQIDLPSTTSSPYRYPHVDNEYNVDIGTMSHVCTHCNALKWKNEPPGLCCLSGQVQLDPLTQPPLLRALFEGTGEDCLHFLDNIRRYNACFQMTSFGANQVRETGFMPTFKVHGQVYHLVGSLFPINQNDTAKFLQLYFVNDREDQVAQRSKNFPQLKHNIIVKLQDMLHSCNEYVKSFKAAIDCLHSPECQIVIYADRTPPNEHPRRFNAPSSGEIGVILAGEGSKRDIVLHQRNSTLKRVSETNRAYDALQYPLLFPHGEDGYHFQLRHFSPVTNQHTTKKISAAEFYSYRMMQRENELNLITMSKTLGQQFWVDMYAKIESERLSYLENNQKQLRADQYSNLRDALNHDNMATDIGQSVILPSTFTGGPRYMHERAQDAMCYVRSYGRPDLFITFTSNPKWEEITRELQAHQTAQDRHDITARVFHLKHKTLMDLLVKHQIFGAVRCYIFSVEWQKRGLPHVHILLWFLEKISPEDIDRFVSAELPSKDADPLLFEIVKSNMIHGPCGLINPSSPCMKNGLCTKSYSKPLLCETQTGHDGYPLYKRTPSEYGGFKTTIKIHGNETEVDNKWIVPHNPLLCRLFKAHINVEVCTSIKSIKYVCKYICKGSDMAVFQVQHEGVPINEIRQYQIGRYISTSEAIWRILAFPIHERYPPVVHLSVHLENGQRVYFTNDTAQTKAAQPPATTLTAFFSLCKNDIFSKTLLYNEVPQYYTWNLQKREWRRRVRGFTVPDYHGIKSSHTIGRVYSVHPRQAECCYLRLLLHTVRGPTSFAALRTVNGHEYHTYREACNVLGLLEDDFLWESTMEEAALCQSPPQIRDLFALLLHLCDISNPVPLWEKFREAMAEDVLQKQRQVNPNLNLYYTDAIFNATLIMIEDKLLSLAGGKTLDTYGLPKVHRSDNSFVREIISETSYDLAEMENIVTTRSGNLTPDQADVYDKVCSLACNNSEGIVFLDAPGGTGKTYLINLILAKVRMCNKIAVAVASSGIAATLLKGGKTAHSTFKLPLNLASKDKPMCNIRNESGLGQLLKKTSLIVWDECTMSHKHAFEALDRTLRDLRKCDLPMGGVTVLLAGDFRQTLPVITRGTRADQVNACLKSSSLWKGIEKMTLLTNMRVHLHRDPSGDNFSKLLLQIGDGVIISHPDDGLIILPEELGTVVKTPTELIDCVFPDLIINYKMTSWLSERAILAPRNDIVHTLNQTLLDRLPGEQIIYNSVDTIPDIDQSVNYPVEFLNSLSPSGMPPHELKLKPGCSIMLLRNLDPPKLCNGTRLVVVNLHKYLIEATIATGEFVGQSVIIPRIPLLPSDCPFEFRRLQFPVSLSFAMSINKSQGQTLSVAGLFLKDPCFSHGQLYVACSRVGRPESLFLCVESGKTRNVVYHEVLQAL